MTDYILEISAGPDAALDEIVQARLFLVSSRGCAATESGIEAYFDTAEAREEAVAALADLPVEVRRVEREPVDWLDRYQQSLHAIEIGERFVVAPEASLLPADGDRIGIVVPQEQAFGTGSHESTALCMALLETIDVRGRKGLDVGSGSGILAIAAQRLGAAKVIAFDVDPDAYGALRDNRMRNRITGEQMPLFIGPADALRGGAFDFVLMNILPEVIVSLLPGILPRLADQGRMIVSGILSSVRDEFVSAVAPRGIVVTDEAMRGEWWAGVLQRSR